VRGILAAHGSTIRLQTEAVAAKQATGSGDGSLRIL
jgi:hypothetical protein